MCNACEQITALTIKQTVFTFYKQLIFPYLKVFVVQVKQCNERSEILVLSLYVLYSIQAHRELLNKGNFEIIVMELMKVMSI